MEVELLDGNSMINFLGTTILFSTEAVPFYILTSNVQGFQFLHILANTCCFLFFLKLYYYYYYF